jgi:alpha-L-arabinofuranosidase
VARWGRGTVLELEIDAMTPGAVEATAVYDPTQGGVTVFAVNRADREIRLDALLRGFDRLVAGGQSVLTDPDLTAHNTATDPYRIVPKRANGCTIEGERLAVRLPARSWSVVRLAAPEAGSRPGQRRSRSPRQVKRWDSPKPAARTR